MNHPKLTPADLEAAIRSEFYFTGKDGVLGESEMGTAPSSGTYLDQLTFCVLVLDNGARVVGINYGPVVPANFDPKMARDYARKAAVDQLWPLLGFRLRDKVRDLQLTASGYGSDQANAQRAS